MRLVRSIGMIAATVALLAADSAVARPGDLDPTFSNDGFAQVDLLSKAQPGAQLTQDPAQLAGIGPAGEIVLGANTRYGYGCNREGCGRNDFFVGLARLLPNGALDQSFAGDGTFESDFGLPYVRGSAYAVQPDGKVLVAASTFGAGANAFVARLNADGTLDEAFGDNGLAMLPTDVGATAMALAPDGRIVLGGSTRGAEFQPGFYGLDGVVALLLPDGTLDPSFGGGDGTMTFDLTRIDQVDDLAVDGQGRIVAAGTYDTGDGNEINAVTRLLPDGSLDPGFSADGSLQVDLAPDARSIEAVSALVIDSENRPILSISSVVTGPGISPFRRALLRYAENGSPDTGFGGNGQVFIEDVPDPASDAADRVKALSLDSQGRMLIGGGGRGLVGRRLSDGSPDPSFGTQGWIQVDPPQGAYSVGLLADPAGRVVVIGGTADTHAQVARLRTDGDPPDDLDADGLTDDRDPCPSVYAPGSGCTANDRSLTIRRKSRWVAAGELSSPSLHCVSGFEIVLLRERKGRDRRVTSIQSDPLGASINGVQVAPWQLEVPRARGRYYARVRASFGPVSGDCGGARSRTIRLGGPRRH